jgi:hypothetical protein
MLDMEFVIEFMKKQTNKWINRAEIIKKLKINPKNLSFLITYVLLILFFLLYLCYEKYSLTWENLYAVLNNLIARWNELSPL